MEHRWRNKDEVLVLRSCKPDMTSIYDSAFKWPKRGWVEAPDWIPVKCCGEGLHGALWGEGDGCLFTYYDEGAKWLVVAVPKDSIIDLGGKVKFPRGRVVHAGDRKSATAYLAKYAPGRAIVGATAIAGDYGTATAGDRGTAIAGDRGTAIAGDYGTAIAGDYGTAIAGDYGTATAGYYGTAIAGCRGTAIAGNYGTIQIRYEDIKERRYRIITGYIGEGGLRKDTAYRLSESLEFVEVQA